MPRLMLLRHAKADWPTSESGPKRDDHDRPLNERGRRDAAQMGEYLHAHRLEPALVLCSTASRTRETWALIAPALSGKPEVRFEPRLYLAGSPLLLAAVRKTAAPVPSLMLIGHNPGLEQLAQMLAGAPHTAHERDAIATLTGKFPTCALAVLEFPGAWRDVAARTGRLLDFVRPKDIRDD